MTDYIKREDALKELLGCVPTDVHEIEDLDVIRVMLALPSADVAPVRHGRWIVGDSLPMHDIAGNLSWGNWYVCTGCGFATTAIEGHITQYKYCPNCGAKMDEEETNE